MIFIKKIINSFLTPKWKNVYNDFNSSFVKSNNKKILFYILSKFWFLPHDYTYRYWYRANISSKHYYTNYAALDTNARILISKIQKYSSKNSKILDLGCNIGRHLTELKKLGYNNLYGVDIGRIPIAKSKKVFPNLKSVKNVCSSFEEYLSKTPANFFYLIYTHGATIELVKPTFPLISQLYRVLTTSGYLIFLIHENEHSYPRFWRYEFKVNNLSIVSEKIINTKTLFVLKKNKIINTL
jgi:SAM-dependent methyltransferase